jgi:hypothetical protein
MPKGATIQNFGQVVFQEWTQMASWTRKFRIYKEIQSQFDISTVKRLDLFGFKMRKKYS